MGLNITERLSFLGSKFDVFDESKVSYKIKDLVDLGFDVLEVKTNDDDYLGLVTTMTTGDKVKVSVSVSKYVFDIMVDSDPTPNKMYTQWMLNTFNRFLKNGDISSAIRFGVEDLPLAKEYLMIFDGNKRKQRFKMLCVGSRILKDITDPSDINQYKSLSQLYDAVDPFIQRDASDIERLLYRFVDSGQARIGVRDRKFTVYIPLTRDASSVFNSFANWCTSKVNNGMFKHYTENYKTPSGKKSNIYIIINNDFFEGLLTDSTLFQIHFETDQIKDRKNTTSNVSIFDGVLMKSENLSSFFYDELVELSKESKSLDNIYVKMLIKFGFTDVLFDIIDETAPFIIFKNKDIPKMGNVSKFKNLELFEMNNTNLSVIHDSVFTLTKLEVIVLRDNRLTTIPDQICQLKNLVFLNVLGNNIVEIPETIKYLDKSNGGSLHRMAVSIRDIGEKNYIKLKRLLPNVIINPQ